MGMDGYISLARRCRSVAQSLLISGLLLVASVAPPPSEAAGNESLYLLFPHDYLAYSQDERRMYVLGVLDARFNAPRGPAPRAAIECLARIGISRVRATLERDVIRKIGAAATPMPFAIDHALQLACQREAPPRRK